MRTAPLKGDCLICQAPEPTRVAINAAIWPEGGEARATDYRAAACRVAEASHVPELAKLDPKTVTRHVEHIELSWRVLGPNEAMRDDEVPLATDFGSLMEHGSRLGAKMLNIVEKVADELGPAMFVFYPKETLAAAKLGLGAAATRETSRLKRNQQAIDVIAIFGASSGHLKTPSNEATDAEDAATLTELRDDIGLERALLAARAGGDVSRETPEAGDG